MRKIFVVILAFGLFCLACGVTLGYELAVGQADYEATVYINEAVAAEKDYYTKATNLGYDSSPMSEGELLEFLEYCRNLHQLWLDHPEWYDYDQERIDNERKLVIAYQRAIDTVEGDICKYSLSRQ